MTGFVFEATGPGSVAAHRIGTAITGPVTVLPAELLNSAREVEAPAGFTELPALPHWLGREDALGRLRAVFEAAPGQPAAGSVVVQGLGGVGKSTLALAYAHRHRRDHTVVWWVAAASPAQIEQSLADLALRLAPTSVGGASTEERAAWALLWLRWHPGWLLVFDNVEDPADLRPFLGAPDGCVLATSRRSAGWPGSVPALVLDVLDPAEASELLCRHVLGETPPTPRQAQEARALAADLGQLPIALEQAGAYLAQNPTIGIESYRRRLTAKLDKASDGVDPERTVARIWRQTIGTLTERDPLAVSVLSTLAWLAPDSVPVALLAPLADDPDDPDDLHEALGTLRAYGMVSLTRDTVGVHRLVQVTLRGRPAPGGTAPAGRREAEELLCAAVLPLGEPPRSGRSAAWERILPHLVALAATTPEGHPDTFPAGRYAAAATYLTDRGHDARAVPLLTAALARCEELAGAEHEITLRIRANLARAHHSAGDFERSITILEPMAAQCAQVFGDMHPEALTIDSNLANSYRASGDLPRAVALHEATLARRRRALGDDHPDTLVSYEELAGTYQAAGDLERAIPLHEATLAQYERRLGPAHPRTLTSRSGLATALLAAGDLDRAIPLYTAVLSQRRQAFGDSDPGTITSRNNLACAYTVAGRPDRAAQQLEVVLALSEEVHGEAHPETIAVRANLGCAFRDAGDVSRSVSLLETAAAQSAHLLGDTHPQTLTTRNGLAQAYQAAGDPVRAIDLYETVLDHRTRLIGESHPHTLATRSGLAKACLAADDPDRAVSLFESTVAQCEQVFGESHPDTLANLIGLADALQLTADPVRAVPLMETTLERCVGSLGEDHPHTVICRINLATMLLMADDARRAVQLLEVTMPHASRLLGNLHPRTVTGWTNLAGAHLECGDAARAVAVLEELCSRLEPELGGTHPQTLDCTVMLALVHGRSGGLARATELLERTVALTGEELGPTHADTLAQTRYLAEMYRADGRPDRAVPLYEADLAHWRQTFGDHPNVLIAQLSLADAHQEAGAHRKAVALYRAALERIEPGLGAENPFVAQVRARLEAAGRAARETEGNGAAGTSAAGG
ncbi:tetratricopeptide repeat protein [Kitasatospora sp. NPDC097605]|uniref:tetratricopeptide repeat protein n=1 Tax=Kitasatospora sp. NPDC097605 TaxID=3157226 RepID=UPI003329949B